MAHTCALRKPSFQRPGTRDEGSAAQEYADIHGQYMSMVHDLIEGNLESSTYEDRCRALLGELIRPCKPRTLQLDNCRIPPEYLCEML